MENLVDIVDDEDDIRELVAVNLKKAGYKTKEYSSGNAFVKSLSKSKPDLLILDLMMPGMDGIEVCRIMKKDDKYSDIPIIMLTAKTDETDRVLGLEMGADDYVSKPFSPRELTARVKAVLRRKERKGKDTGIEHGGILKIDPEKFEVYVKGDKISLTSTEFKILTILMEQPGRVFSREQLLDMLWGDEKIVVDRTIDVHIKHLREKIGAAGKLIKNIRGVGYKLEE